MPPLSPSDDCGIRALSYLRGLRGAPEDPPLCRETPVCRTANVGTVGKNRLRICIMYALAVTINSLKNVLELTVKKCLETFFQAKFVLEFQ